MASESPYIPPPPMPLGANEDGTPQSPAQIDAEWQAYVRECQAINLATIHRTTPEAIKRRWAEEEEFRAERGELESLADAERSRLGRADMSVFDARSDGSGSARSAVPWTAGYGTPPSGVAEVRASTTDPDPSGLLSPNFTAEVEFRGETMHYIEPHRRTSCQFFWTREYCIYADTFTNWVATTGHPLIAGEKLMEAERRAIVNRLVAWAKRTQGVTLVVYNNNQG